MRIHRFPGDDREGLNAAVDATLHDALFRKHALLFDFDGVLSSKSEDWIYKLPEKPGEADELSRLAAVWGMNLAGYDTLYQRHLLYQAAAATLKLPIEEGPACAVAQRESQAGAKTYVLTARSGPHAIARMQAFLEQKRLEPVEVYHVGRVRKDRQIALLLDTFTDHRILFFEDSEEHVKQVIEALGDNEGIGRLEIFLIDYEGIKFDPDSLRRSAWEVLARGANLVQLARPAETARKLNSKCR
jgi:hypothetical protein